MTPPRPGLAVERTVLAWTRTWLALGVCGLLLLRLTSGSPPRVAAVLAVVALALLVLTVMGRRRAVRLRALAVAAPPGPLVPAARAAAVTAVMATAFGLVAAVLVATR